MLETIELRNNWVWSTLEECVEILDKKRIPVNKTERLKRIEGRKESELVPYYGATGQVGWIDDFIFNEELVLLGEDGAPFLDPLKDVAYIIRGKSWVNNHAHVLKAIEGIITNQYLCYYLNKFDFREYVTGTTRLKLNQSMMRKIPIHIPPLSEQVRIVGRVEELFSRLDAGVRSLQAAQTQLEQYRQTSLRQAYTGKLTQKWRQKNPIKIELVTEEDGIEPYRNLITWDIPTEWKWASLRSLIESMQNGIYKPKEFYSNDGIACLRMYNIENGKIVWKDIKRMILTEDEFNKFLLKPDDILINRVNSRELVGKSAVIPYNLEPSVYESKNIRMRINQDTVSSHYVQYWMRFFSSRYFNLNAQQVVGMASINQTQILNMPIPMTTMKEQEKIVEIINNINLYLERIGQTIVKNSLLATHLKNNILKKAFEGWLVPQNPNDEPASLLIERIKVQKVKQRKLM